MVLLYIFDFLLFIQDFDGEALEKFVKESSIPLITVFDKDPNNHPYVIKFFDSPNTKVSLIDLNPIMILLK